MREHGQLLPRTARGDMAVNGGVDSARSRARALLDDVGPGDHDHPDFRDVASGGILWKASLVLLHFLERNVELRGKRVLEISAGEGHLACELQRYGAHVTATEHAGFTAKEVGSDYQRLKASVDARATREETFLRFLSKVSSFGMNSVVCKVLRGICRVSLADGQ